MAKKKEELERWQKLGLRRAQKILSKIQEAQISPIYPISLQHPWSVQVSMIDSAHMARLNQKYRNKAYPTDVLSFPSGDPFWGLGQLGEMVLCLPVLEAQAKEQGHGDRDELDVLLVHGTLHLLGYDHEKGKKQAQEMAKLELKLLENLNDFNRSISQRSGLITRVIPARLKKRS